MAASYLHGYCLLTQESRNFAVWSHVTKTSTFPKRPSHFIVVVVVFRKQINKNSQQYCCCYCLCVGCTCATENHFWEPVVSLHIGSQDQTQNVEIFVYLFSKIRAAKRPSKKAITMQRRDCHRFFFSFLVEIMLPANFAVGLVSFF